MQMDIDKLNEAVKLIRKSKYIVAFTGAGISVESGIPPFRGSGGIWNTTHPVFLEIDFFKKKPLQSWKKIKEIFYDKLGDAEPNLAHEVLAAMEKRSFLSRLLRKTSITCIRRPEANMYMNCTALISNLYAPNVVRNMI
jgi:NAD-dependent deacetylase